MSTVIIRILGTVGALLTEYGLLYFYFITNMEKPPYRMKIIYKIASILSIILPLILFLYFDEPLPINKIKFSWIFIILGSLAIFFVGIDSYLNSKPSIENDVILEKTNQTVSFERIPQYTTQKLATNEKSYIELTKISTEYIDKKTGIKAKSYSYTEKRYTVYLNEGKIAVKY